MDIISFTCFDLSGEETLSKAYVIPSKKRPINAPLSLLDTLIQDINGTGSTMISMSVIRHGSGVEKLYISVITSLVQRETSLGSQPSVSVAHMFNCA